MAETEELFLDAVADDDEVSSVSLETLVLSSRIDAEELFASSFSVRRRIPTTMDLPDTDPGDSSGDPPAHGDVEATAAAGAVEFDEASVRDIDWEVLFAADDDGCMNGSMDSDGRGESYSGDDTEDSDYATEDELHYGQFPQLDSFMRGGPPAAKSVVESLQSVALTEEDAAADDGRGDMSCAVCKDEIPVQDSAARRLPCSHHYHGECILEWLSIRNTCPVCRYELPTDDEEYEKRRAAEAAMP